MESAKPVGPPTAIYKIYHNPQHAILRYPLHCYHCAGDIIILYNVDVDVTIASCPLLYTYNTREENSHFYKAIIIFSKQTFTQEKIAILGFLEISLF